MPSYKNLNLKRHYDSDVDNVFDDFYSPLVKTSILYKRAVGYFSAGTLRRLANELSSFISLDGKIYLIIGCFVSRHELEGLPIDKVDEFTKEHLKSQLIESLKNLEITNLDSAVLLSRLVTSGVVEIRFALRQQGIYHEKYGVFQNLDGETVTFNGSNNETEAAAELNHESFDVYFSYENEFFEAYGKKFIEKFDLLWDGRSRGTKIYEIQPEILEHMKRLVQANPVTAGGQLPKLRPVNQLRPYQKNALDAWRVNGYRGILAMATGTGKTITAIEAVKKFKEKIPSGLVVITVPYQNLAEQWVSVMEENGFETLKVYDSFNDWSSRLTNNLLAAQLSRVRMPCIVVVEKTFNSQKFQEIIQSLGNALEKNHLIIADECHHFNKEDVCERIPSFFNFRLGLSATPYDQFSEHHLDKYFDKIVFTFGLSDAISNGFLTKYKYGYFTVGLDDDESALYDEITQKIIRIAGGEEIFDKKVWPLVQPFLSQRSRIVAGCSGKIATLKKHLSQKDPVPYSLFYCGAASSLDDDGESTRQVELLSKILHELGWKTSRITADESLGTREKMIDMLRTKQIDAIISIKVLDEGIDIPACRSAYLLASQASDRQGIQRRGRVLRKAEGKELAELYDFLVIGGSASSKAIKNLAKKEIRRAYNFSKDAINFNDLKVSLEDLAKQAGFNLEEVYEQEN